MPKKRKSQKIIADLRRKIAAQKIEEVSFSQKKTVEKKPLRRPKSAFQAEILLSPFIISDLKKSLFLFLLAISLEFVLYYVLEMKGF